MHRKNRKRSIPILPILVGVACCACVGLVLLGVTSGGFEQSTTERASEAFSNVSDKRAMSEGSTGSSFGDSAASQNSTTSDGLAITTAADGTSYVSNQILVAVDTSEDAEALSRKLSDAGVEVASVSSVCTYSDGTAQLLTVTYTGGDDPVTLSERLSEESLALTVEPNYIATLSEEGSEAGGGGTGDVATENVLQREGGDVVQADSSVSLSRTSINDTYASCLWQLDAVNAYDAWDSMKTSGAVTVAVLDSGVDYDHSDLVDNLILGDYARNVSVSPSTSGGSAVDDNLGHGTHVSGIIAATANNALGVAGVSYNAKVLPVKITSTTSFSSSNIIEGIDYVIGIKQAASSPDYIKNIKVINLSLGMSGTSAALVQAVTRAENAGITVVAATGNENVGTVNCPASVESVIGVGSIAKSSGGYSRSGFSNYGTGINVVAPGSSIYSAITGNSYGSMSGTSMATPVVSGVAALLYAADSSLTTSGVREALTETATDLGDEGWDIYYGSGLVDAEAAVDKVFDEKTTTVSFDLSGISNPGTTMYIDGVAQSMSVSGASGTITLSDSTARVATLYTYNKTSSDVHEVYPIHMYVWLLECQGDKTYSVTRMAGFDDLLQYAGTSIRLSGNKGTRMITSLPTAMKQALAGSGYEGWQLEEYGTVIQFDETLAGADVLLTNTTYKNYAYKRGVADPVYSESGGRTCYTNVLVGFNDEQCGKDLSMRSYIILSNVSTGENITIYGGTTHRSIGYVALQNKDLYPEGTDAGNYIWGIIRSVYGSIYG